jgi:hypothetical protein
MSLDGPHKVLFWVLPANVSGAWKGKSKNEEWTLQITQKFQNISGRLSWNGKDFSPVSKPTITGDRLSFSFFQEGRGLHLVFDGKVAGHTLEGIIKENGVAKGTLRVMRDHATVSKIY